MHRKPIVYILYFLLINSSLLFHAQTHAATGCSSHGNIYYLSSHGNNDHNGSYSRPWRDLGYAVGQLNTGDTLCVMAGKYYALLDDYRIYSASLKKYVLRLVNMQSVNIQAYDSKQPPEFTWEFPSTNDWEPVIAHNAPNDSRLGNIAMNIYRKRLDDPAAPIKGTLLQDQGAIGGFIHDLKGQDWGLERNSRFAYPCLDSSSLRPQPHSPAVSPIPTANTSVFPAAPSPYLGACNTHYSSGDVCERYQERNIPSEYRHELSGSSLAQCH